MKSALTLIAFVLLTSSAFARIVEIEHRYYVETNGVEEPISLLNDLVVKKQISTIKIYSGGKLNMVSFAKKGEKEKHYSVDGKGFMYEIQPFSNYRVSRIDRQNMIHFAEAPKKRFFINSDGFFIHK